MKTYRITNFLDETSGPRLFSQLSMIVFRKIKEPIYATDYNLDFSFISMNFNTNPFIAFKTNFRNICIEHCEKVQ